MTQRALFLLVAALLLASCTGAAGSGAGAGPAAAPAGSLGEQRSEAGAVEVVATWVAADPPSLAVTLDTHSVDLDEADLATLARVRLDGGPWAVPSAVDVPNGSHHREGTLTFAALGPGFGTARVIELEIRDVAVPVRLLTWERGR